jgi:hypothetical protein
MQPKRSMLFIVRGLTLALALILSACGAPAPATDVPPGELTGALTVLDWAGYDAEDFWVDFKNTYPKVNVSFEIGSSDSSRGIGALHPFCIERTKSRRESIPGRR